MTAINWRKVIVIALTIVLSILTGGVAANVGGCDGETAPPTTPTPPPRPPIAVDPWNTDRKSVV